jgi:AcrR family transcriptional regulator
VSESFPELAQAVIEHAQPGRIDVLRAKRHVLGQLGDGRPHSSAALIASIEALLEALPLDHYQVDLPSRDSVKAVVTAEHPVTGAIRADLAAREALAELAAEGMLIAAGSGPVEGSGEIVLSFRLPECVAQQRVLLNRPAVPSDVVRLPHRLRQPGLWGLEPDIFIDDLAALGLDPRTERSLREAIESYRRGVFLAACSLLGTAVEGAWYAAGLRLRSAAPTVDEFVESDQTAQLQNAVAAVLRDALPGTRKWEAHALGQFARLMRDVRNYGVHPRQAADGDIEVYFAEDKCGLLFLEGHRHLKQLADATALAIPVLAGTGSGTRSAARRASYGGHSPVVRARGERTRQAVLDAAAGTFDAQGLQAASIEDIAEAAGVSRATLYQYFESKDQIFTELAGKAADELLAVIRRPPDLAPTDEGYRSLRRWLYQYALVQDRYQALALQWAVIDLPEAQLRMPVADYIVSYVSSMTPWLGAAVGDSLDVDGTAAVLLDLLFKLNDHRENRSDWGLTDAELLTGLTTFVQFVLFPETPPTVVPPLTGMSAGPRDGAAGGRHSSSPVNRPASAPPPASGTARRILDAGAAVFAQRGYHDTSVQDVVAAAGTSRSTFYRHFDGQADLLVHLARECIGQLVEQVGLFPAAVSEADALRPWLEEQLTLQQRYRGVIRALLQQRVPLPALEELRASSEFINSTLDGALASVPRPYPFDVRVGSRILLAFLERGADYSFGTPYDLDLERVLDILTTFLQRGLLART